MSFGKYFFLEMLVQWRRYFFIPQVTYYHQKWVLFFHLIIGIFGNKIRRKETILLCLLVSSICVYAIFGIPSYDTFYYGNITWNVVFVIMVILILAAAADIDPSGRLGAWLNACILLSASLAPAVFGWIMLENEMTVIYPYLILFLIVAMTCIFSTKKDMEPIDKV